MEYVKIDFERIKHRVMWDFRVEDEAILFKERRTGVAFIVDVLDGIPRLALYRVTRYGSKSDFVEHQPPQELLEKALTEQGANPKQDGLYNSNQELRLWIEQNILN